MGYDAACTLQLDGRSSRGTALLEHKDLIFRGDRRLVIPLATITSARADGGRLEIQFAGQTAVFILGPAAAKWAEKIAHPPSRLDKLGVKAGMSVRFIGFDDDVFVEELAQRGARVMKRGGKTGVDLVFYGASKRAALDRMPELMDAIAPDGGIWVVRPKGITGITEADVRAAGRHAGLVDVKVVSFSDTHSAEKFVIPRSARRG